MSRSEIWREEYMRDRYLADASQAEYDRRLAHIFNNVFDVTPAGKYGVVKDLVWLELWTHVLEESRLRGRHVPDALKLAWEFGLFRNQELSRRAGELCRNIRTGPNSFIKYTRKEWAKNLVLKGEAKVSAASSYNRDSSLNLAQKDNELLVDILRRFKYRFRKTKKKHPFGFAEVKRRFELKRDFFVFCGSTSLSPRLFLDFDADACVVIHDRAEFGRRLGRAMKSVVGDSLYQADEVRYYDPYFPPSPHLIKPGFTKQLGFAYQKEFRCAWWPKSGSMTSLQGCIDIGSLEDIADWYCL